MESIWYTFDIKITYKVRRWLYFSIIGIGCCICVGSLSIAMKYESAARLSPMLYLENVMTLISDVTVFGYEFSITDYLGITTINLKNKKYILACMIMIWLLVPSFYRIYEENKKEEQEA